MPLHPTAEAYRRAVAAGDTTTAASLLVSAHQGRYDADLISQLHEVGRMTKAQRNAPMDLEPESTERVRVTTRIFSGSWS